jgi:predicted secreted hydrolase
MKGNRPVPVDIPSLSAADFRIQATGRWRSPTTRMDYPSGWTVEVPSACLALRIEPAVADQELRPRGRWRAS